MLIWFELNIVLLFLPVVQLASVLPEKQNRGLSIVEQQRN